MKHGLMMTLLLAALHCAGQVDTSLINTHLLRITKSEGYRNHLNTDLLDHSADYIHQQFSLFADSVTFQSYEANGRTYRNVIASFNIEKEERVIIGAHYDVCGEVEGADDNASGVVALLELSRMLATASLNYRVDLVAYSLEEPPYFRTEYMGSAVHAKSMKDNDCSVYGAVAIDMIGFFSDEKGSQSYPAGFLSWFYGNKGDYITLVNKFGKGQFARRFSRQFRRSKKVKTKRFTGPQKLEGIDFSDHLNYWKQGYSALMVTDTGFFRNPHYHQKSDTIETLDLRRMSLVIEALHFSLVHLK